MIMNVSSLTHFIATLLSVAGLSVLVTLAAIQGTAVHVVSFSIFGAALILLYLASTLYHFLSHDHPRKGLFQVIDHSMIYVLIAGTYTPLALLVLPPAWGWSIFGIIWGLALTGIVIKAVRLHIPGWLSAFFYLLMGWLIVIAFMPLSEALAREALFWLVFGGIFYTIGTIFFALDKGLSATLSSEPGQATGFAAQTGLSRQRWWTFHDVFHICVMFGSASHFWFMLKFVL